MLKSRLTIVAAVLLLTAMAIAAINGCGGASASGPKADESEVAALRKSLVVKAGGGETVKAVEWKGYGTLRGTIKMSGDPRAQKPLAIVGAGVAVCKPGGKDVFPGDLIVDPQSGGIKNVIVYVETAIPEDKVHESARKPTEPTEVVFDQKNCMFLTRVLPIRVGTTMQIINSDTAAAVGEDVGHNVSIGGKPGNAISQTIAAGGKLPFKPPLEERQPIEVKCGVHPWMLSWLLPRNNGYFALTDKDGKFELKSLPGNGPLTVRLWHEAVPGATKAIKTFTVGGAHKDKIKPTGNGFTVTMQDGDDVKHEELVLEVPASVFP